MNPDWPEFETALAAGCSSSDRPDLSGKSVGYLIATSFFWLEHKIDKTDIDNYISAEIPDPNTSPRLYKIVTTNMIHNPCVGYDESSPCIVKNKCSENFPKPYRKDTFVCNNGYPLYRRRAFGEDGVTYLPIHLEGEHNIFYVEEEASMSVEHQLAKVTPTFFKLCENDVFARTLLYTEVPTHYVFCKKSGVWTERSRGSISIGRMQTTNSKNAELFYLRLMLSHVRGPKSFSDIRTVEGVEYATYREAVKAMGLMKDKDLWEKTLMEIVNHTNNGKDLRSTYATMLVFCDLEDQSEVWLDIRDYFARDFLYKSGKTHYNDEIYLDALDEIQEYVYNCGGADITVEGRTSLPASRGLEKSFNLLRREKSYNTVQLIEDVCEKLPMLNKEQREIFDAVIGVVGGKDRGKGKGFFFDAPGATGKSFLLNLLLDAVRSKRGIALAVASSGIVATVLHGGRTAHNMFKIPLMESHELRSCSIKKNTQMSKLLGMCSLIVWDEVVMANKNMLLAVDITLRGLLSANEFMGGIPFVCAGDFRQILPVVKGGGSNQEISATIKNTYFWEELRKYALTENIRLRGPDEHGHNKIFAECLLQIGHAASGLFAIPENLVWFITTKRNS
ncbi:uncharacterized protein LOC143039740 [Oratosquilla oratoria]|uniref:uncharacterized protein LOC143039740 n=1 Tax=Oratosquilla oratoria TaxID=337810 RepID=UPI003F75EA41